MNLNYQTKNELLNLLNTKKLLGIEHINHIELIQKKEIFHDLPDGIDDLYNYVSNCSLCELSKSKMSLSFNKGTFESKIIFINTYSNKDSEKEFQNFKDIIEKILKVNINDIYMTNILKCNVEKIKVDIDNEITKCIPYLEKQISLLNPNLIITFGKAFNYLTNNNDDIINISGNLFSYKGTKIIPLLEIDFINKNPSYNDNMINDLYKIKNILDEK